jgi:hypothetical protein
MIESLFRMLKNNYLYHQGINGIEDLVRKAAFYFHQHNYVIPLASQKGGRPAEVYVSSWGEVERNELQANKAAALMARKKKNLVPPCEICPSDKTYTAAEKFGGSGTEKLVFQKDWL